MFSPDGICLKSQNQLKMSIFFLYDIKGHLYMLPPFPFSCFASQACKSFTLSMLTEAYARAGQGSPCFAKVWMTVISKFLEKGGGGGEASLKIYENDGRMCLICKTLKDERQCSKWERERHSVFPA